MKFFRANLLALLLSAAVIALLLFQFFFSAQKVSYVGSARLMSGYKGMVEVRSEFEKKRKTWQANVDSLTKEVKDAISKYDRTIAIGTDKEKQLSKELISTKQKQLYEYQNAISQNASQEEQRLTQPVLATVNPFLTRYGKQHGYKMILVAANGNIAYADASTDITDAIVDQLNKEYAIPGK